MPKVHDSLKISNYTDEIFVTIGLKQVLLLYLLSIMRRILFSSLFFLLFAFSKNLHAQTEPKVVQISGVVLASDSLYPAQFVGIYRAKDLRGTFSDMNGYFTLPVMAGDTLNFRCLGLKPSTFIVPADTKENQLSLVQWMDADTTTLSTVYVLPYPAPHKLRQEILALDLPGDNYFAFRRSSNSSYTYDGLADFKDAAATNGMTTLDARYNNGFQSGGNVLSPAAWSSFMQSLRRKKK